MMKDELTDFDILNIQHLPYRRSVGIMLLNKHKCIFVGKRLDTKTDEWQMPQGGIENDESIIEAGRRELYEETNITDVKILAQTSHWLYYDVPDFFLGKLWEGKYRGQKQKWLLALFNGDDSVINISKLAAEFQEWKWIEVNKLHEVAVSYKKNLYSTILEEFRHVIDNMVTT